jgi:hypothetical protein
MSNFNFDGDDAVFTLANPSAFAVHEYLTLDLTVSGVHRYFWVPFDLPAGRHRTISVHFLKPVTLPIFQPCADHTIGIVETPDPIYTVTMPPPQL